jgi:predicted nuclease with TOPRIM domain
MTKPPHDLHARIAELEKDVKKWKLSTCHWQDINGEVEAENAKLKEDLAMYVGAEANEYGQSQQRIAKLEAENAKLKEHIKAMQETISGEALDMKEQNKRYKEALKTCNQFVLEVSHAMQCGPDWYTRGESGLRNQIQTWINKASEAVKVLDDNGKVRND